MARGDGFGHGRAGRPPERGKPTDPVGSALAKIVRVLPERAAGPTALPGQPAGQSRNYAAHDAISASTLSASARKSPIASLPRTAC